MIIKKEKNITKKSLLLLMIMILLFGVVYPVLAVSGSSSFVASQFGSYYFTTDNQNTDYGIIIRKIYDRNKKEWKTVFCSEHGIDISTGDIHSATYNIPTDERIKYACKIAYFGWYSKYGDYIIDGEITPQRKKDFAFTQQFIWEALGQSNATFIKSAVQSEYVEFKNNITAKINEVEQRPSFDATTVTIDVGDTVILTDENGVLKDYNSLDKNIDGIRLQHNKGENTLTITVDENCTTESYRITDSMIESWGIIKEGTQNYDTTLYFDFPTNVQDQIYSLSYNDPVTMALNLRINIYGNLEITKKDNKGNVVADTSFKLSYNANMSDEIGTYTTDKNGKIVIENLKPGTIYIQENSVPEHLILDDTIKSTTIESSTTTTFEATNSWKQAYIKVTKKDAETGKAIKQAGVVFDIYNAKNEKVSSINTNADGIATSQLLDYGTYYVKEVKAPDKYILNGNASENIVIKENGKTYEISILNNRVKGSVTISKEDSKTGEKAQGDASLKGAVYGVYARNTIHTPADGAKIYDKDEKIGEITTNDEAKASMSNLYIGEYYLQEIKASKGYTIDATKYNFDITSTKSNVNVIVKEKVMSQAFQIIKISSEDGGEAELLPSAEFTIKLKSDIEKYGSWEKAPIAKNAKGETAAILVTDGKGYAMSEKLPYGTYVVRETKVPDNKYKVPDFTVVISEDSDNAQTWRVFNDTSFTSILAIIKEDAETNKVVKVEGATFKIKNIDTNEYFGYWQWNPLPHYVDKWTTDETGTVMTAERMKAGNYQLEEIKSPNGYLINSTPVKFSVSSNTVYETLPDGMTAVITVKMKDTAVKGKIEINKYGDVLVDFKEGKFVYENKELANAKYEVIAREDILDSVNDGTVIYKKGTVVDTVTTNTSGKAITKELPLGEYLVKEISAPNGFVLNDTTHNVSLKYKNQNTAIVYENISFTNERQRVEVKVLKKDAETETGLLGAKFGLYAKNNILNYKGEIILKAGELIETAISDVEGNVHFKSDLPLANFEIKEIQAPIGYATSKEVINVDTNYKGQDISVINLEYEFCNEIIKLEVSKQDITNSEEIEGAHLTIFEKDNEGAIFDIWISTKEPHLIKGLEVGKNYVLRETSSPYGFALSQDVEFTVEDTGKIQSVVMKDELVYGKLKFNKLGEIFNQTVTGQTEFGKTESPAWNESNLLDTQITIFANEDIVIGNTTYYLKDEKVQTLESNWEPVLSKELPVGSYYYVETKVPFGYIADTSKHYFNIEDTQINEVQIVESTLLNGRAKINIDMTKMLEKQDIFINDEAYKDIVFGIFAREDIYDYMGKVAIENCTMISTTGITQDGLLESVPDLPIGVYFIKELATNSQYVLNSTEYDFEIGYKGENVSEYTVQIGNEGIIDNELARGTIQVKKVDIMDENIKLEGIEFNISTNQDMSNVIATSKTDAEGIATFNDLELGKYFIQEAKQVNGYTLNNTIYEVEVKENGDIIIINCENKPTEMTFSKVDETGTDELPDALIQVIDKENDEIIDEWISGEEPHIIYYLIEGKEYIMKEITAPYGYEISEEIIFIAGDGEKVIMKNMPILKSVRVEKIDKTTKEHIKSNKFVFAIYEDEECTKLIKEAGANEYEGTALFKDLRYGTYYIKEIQAPLGYALSKQIVKIEINDEGVFADGKAIEENEGIYSFEYYNLLLPIIQTGNEMNYGLILGMLVISVIGATTTVIVMKKKNRKDK